jgi:hypothetical protein
MTNQTPIAELTKTMIKSYAKLQDIESEQIVDTLVSTVGNLISSQTKTENSTEKSSSNLTDLLGSMECMEDMSGLLSTFMTNTCFERKDTEPTLEITSEIASEITSETTSETITNCDDDNRKLRNTPYSTINNLFKQLWESPTLNNLSQCYTPDAVFTFENLKGMDQDTPHIKWDLTGRSKIIKMFQELWLPKVRNINTKVQEYEFTYNKDTNNYQVRYIINQQHLREIDMRWHTYYITGIDLFNLKVIDDKYYIVRHETHDYKKIWLAENESY